MASGPSSKAREDSSEIGLAFRTRGPLPNSFDQVRRSCSASHIQSNNTPAPTLDLPTADDFIESPVSALGENVWTQRLNQSDRRIGTKADHPIDTAEGRDEFHTLLCRQNGSIGTLGTPNACVEVDGHDELVTETTGLLEASDMANVQEVEASVREDDDLTGTLCKTNPAGQGRRGRDLVSGRRRPHDSSSSRPNRNFNTFIKNWDWEKISDDGTCGLYVTEFYGISSPESSPELIAGGCQDVNSFVYDNDNWYHTGWGDGGKTLIDPVDPNIGYFMHTWYLYRHNNRCRNEDGELLEVGMYSECALEFDPGDHTTLYYGYNYLAKIENANTSSFTVDTNVLSRTDLDNNNIIILISSNVMRLCI